MVENAYQLSDFKRLSWVAKRLAESEHNDPDVVTTLIRCAKAGAGIALFQYPPIYVWVFIKPDVVPDYNPESGEIFDPEHKYDCKYVLVQYEGALFLTSPCIDALVRSGDEKIQWEEFVYKRLHDCVDEHDILRVASERDQVRWMVADSLAKTKTAMLADSRQELVGDRDVDDYPSTDDRQALLVRKEQLIHQVFGDMNFESCSSEAWIEFSVDDVLILTQDIDKVLSVKPLAPDQENTGREGKAKTLVNDLIAAYIHQSDGELPPNSLKQLLLWSKENIVQGYGFVKLVGKGNGRYIEVNGREYCGYSACAYVFKKIKSTNKPIEMYK